MRIIPQGSAAISVNEASFYIYDHLGNTRVTYTPTFQNDPDLNVNFLKITVNSVVDYFPYGKVLRHLNASDERYLTTQHERDESTGLDYRGARYYDSDLGRFLSLDPHAKDYPSLSDYVYVAGNPVAFIDPDGKDIYKVNQSGEIELVKTTDDDFDRLVATGSRNKIKYHKRGENKGEIKNVYIDIEKGPLKTISKQREGRYKGLEINFGERTADAKKTFEFLAKFTAVEWSSVQVSSNSEERTRLFTTFSSEEEYFGANYCLNAATFHEERGITNIVDIHSHPRPANSLGFQGEPSDKDLKCKDLIFSEFEQVKFFIYEEGQNYEY